VATVCVPELAWPEHLIGQEAIVEAVADRRRGLPHLDRGLRVMRNTEVATRRMVQSLDDTLAERSFGQIVAAGQPLCYLREAGSW
jgi:hypothetical protein